MVNAQLCRSKNLRADELVGRTPLEVVRRQQEAGGKDQAFIKHAEQSEAIHDLIMRTGKIVEKEESIRWPGPNPVRGRHPDAGL